MQMGAMRIGIGHARGKPLLAKLLAEVSALGGVLYAPPVSGDWLFQTTTGETVSSASDPVGLMLDVSEGARKVGSNWQALESAEPLNQKAQTGTLPGDLAEGEYVVRRSSDSTEQWWVEMLEAEESKHYLISFTASDAGYGELVNVSAQAANGRTTLINGAGSFSGIVQAPAGFRLIADPPGRSALLTNLSVRELFGDHATQTVSASRPTVGVDGDITYLDFDGTDDYLISGDYVLPQFHAVIAVGRNLLPDVDGLNNSLFEYAKSGASDHCSLCASNNGGACKFRVSYPGLDTYNTGPTISDPENWHIMTMVRSAYDEVKARVDGVEVATFTDVTTDFDSPRKILVGSHRWTPGQKSTANHGPLIVIPGVPSEASIARIENLLKQLYGIS